MYVYVRVCACMCMYVRVCVCVPFYEYKTLTVSIRREAAEARIQLIDFVGEILSAAYVENTSICIYIYSISTAESYYIVYTRARVRDEDLHRFIKNDKGVPELRFNRQSRPEPIFTC